MTRTKRAATAAKVYIDPSEHIEWARAIARDIRKQWKFARNSADQEDLESHAILVLFKRYKKFDFSRVPPDGDIEGAFRG